MFLWAFGKFKVPMIGYLGPKLLELNDESLIIKVPFKRRSKNHLNSMYFGALSVGADLAGGLHSYYFADKLNLKCSVVFKSFNAQFLKRPQSDVYFICNQGNEVMQMLLQAEKSKERITQSIPITAYTNYFSNKEEVAKFTLGLSVKVLN